MTNAELIDKLRILQGAILNPHHRDGEYVDKRFADVCVAAADALEAADRLLDQNTKRCEALRKQLRESHESYEKHINELEAQIPKEGEWLDEQRGRWIYAKCNLCGKVQDVRSNYCPNCGAKMKGEQE